MKTTQWTKWFLAAGCAAVMPLTAARAVEPIPDWITLVFPTMVPKAGNPSTVPANLETSLIRYSYETRFEDYWKETSYYTADPVTGAKTHGAYSDTKTYGYVQMPWPLRARASRGAFAGGSGLSDAFTPATDEGNTGDGARGIGTPNRRHSQAAFDNLFYTFVYDEADADAVWTSGESFNDADNDGQWDAPLPAEDYWDSDHVVPTYGVPTMYNPRNDYLEYSATGGELFADYNGSASYNNAVSVWLWLSGTANIRVTVNEMDFSPSTGTAPPYEGDFVHTLVSDPDMPGNLPVVPGATYVTNVVAGATNITMTIPKNNAFNYTTDADGNAQWAATGSYIEFDAYVTPDAASESAGWYSYNAAVKAPGPYAGTQYSNAVLRTVRVQLYAARELYGTYKSGSAAVQIFGDRYGPQPTPNQDPARRISNADDGAWTAARNGESFEDFLSIYDPARGGQCYVPCPADLEGNTSLKKGNELQNGSENTRGRGLAMAYDTYTNYIAWNYPGAFTSLIARAFNGRYDGPDDWGDQGSSGKWVWDERDTPIAATPAPAPAVQDPVTGGLIWPSSNPGGGWDPRSGYATWDAWYTAVFGGGITPAPAWRGGIPVISRYSPTGARAANGWTPADSWTFDAPAEYCDLPSSIYHLNGDYLVGSTLLIQGIGLVDPFAYAEANAIFIANGDRKLGEVTSPFGDDIWGQDLAGPMANFWGAADGTISCAGPYCFNTIGGHGYDAANLVNLEFMTHRRSGLTRDVDTHPAFLRDTNLDGYLDGGRELQGDANYSSGMGTMGGPGVFTWHRYMEDVISLWDQSEDFAQVLMRTSIPLMYAYPIYPVATNEGWAALGGPSGQVRPFISRDTNAVLSMTFQVRPLNGGGEAPNTTGNFVPDPNWDPTANPPTQDFGMALLTHEQGHDMMGWPDLYDYDVWSAGNPMINTPVAAYDLMAGGGLVHGLVILKEWAATGGPWTLATDITTLVPLDGGPVTLELYPIEKHNDQYLMLQNPAKPEEYLDLWYTDVNTQYGVIGGRGVYIDHLDLASIHNALPVQQKVNNHFTYEMLQADGRTDLQDGMNFGDNGDPFPGAYNQRTFSADTLPASRWWDSSDTGFRILNVELPAAGTDLPALVTVERYSTSATWSLPGGSMGADTDGDGIVDAWEYHYFHGLAIADATTDYDLDGLSDLAEFKAQLDPTVRDSDGDGISDALEDSDGDQLSNGMEDDYGTNPSLADSDDDGIADKVELDQALDPSDSLSPFVLRHLWNNGTGYVEDPVTPPNATVYDLSAWTVEASVRLMAPPADDIILIRRAVEPSGFINYELGIVASNLIPYVRFQTDSGEEYRVDGNSPVAIGQWTFLGGRFGTDPERGTTGQLSLFVDATRIMRDTATTKPATGLQRGKLRFGINLAGDLDEVRIWRTAQPDAWIDARRGKALEFGSDVAIMGSLTNDLGFLQATFDTRMSLNGFSLQSWFSISNGTAVIAERQAGRSPDDGRTLYNYSLHVENGAIVGRYSFYAQIWIDNDGNGQRNAGEVVNRWGTVELVSRNAVNDSRWHHAALTLTGNPGTSALTWMVLLIGRWLTYH